MALAQQMQSPRTEAAVYQLAERQRRERESQEAGPVVARDTAHEDATLARYEALRESSPYQAAAYLLANERAIVAARQRAETNEPMPPSAA